MRPHAVLLRKTAPKKEKKGCAPGFCNTRQERPEASRFGLCPDALVRIVTVELLTTRIPIR